MTVSLGSSLERRLRTGSRGAQWCAERRREHC